MSLDDRFKPFPELNDVDLNYEACGQWYKESAAELNGGELDTLVALMRQGPLYDGDVPSKSARDTLLDLGLATKIVISGRAMPKECRTFKKEEVSKLPIDDRYKHGNSEGFQAATYRGRMVYKALYEIGRIQ